MEIKVEELHSDNFAPFGKILGDNNFPKSEQTEDFGWRDISNGLILSEQNCSGLLNCNYRDMIIRQMECHHKTPEVMVLLEGDSILCVAAPEVKSPDKSDIKAFRVNRGTALMMDSGVWHSIPFPVDGSGAKFLILFRDGTGADDLNFTQLETPLEVDID